MFGGFFGGKGGAPAPAPTNNRPPAPTPSTNPNGRSTGSTVGGGQPIPFGSNPSSGSLKASGFPTTNTTTNDDLTRRGSFGTASSATSSTVNMNKSSDDLFGGLGLKSTTNAPTSGGLGGSSGTDLFGNLSLNSSSSSSSSVPVVASGFSFVAPSTDTSTTANANLPTASTFSFLNSTPAPAPTTASGFSFANTTPSTTSTVLPSSSSSSLPPATSSSSSTANPLPGMEDSNLPVASGIKKKKPGFRPGFARDEPATTTGLPSTNTGGSVLSGLTVHEEIATTNTDDQHTSSLSNNGGGSVLAGMRLHAASDAGEDTATEVPSVLAGLQVHNTSTPNEVVTPMASGFNFVMGGTSSPAVTTSLPAIPPIIPATESDNGMFGNLLKKSTPSVVPTSSSSSSNASVRSVSPTVRMRNNLSDLNDVARQTRMRLADLKIRLRQLIDQDKAANTEVEKWKQKVTDIEHKQDEAIRNELFEVAEQLNESLDAARGSLLAAEGRRRGVLASRASVEEEQAQVFKDSLAAANTTVVSLREYNTDRSTKLNDFRKEAIRRHTSTVERIGAEEEQLRLKEQHVQRDIKTVDDEEKQVESIIREQSEELSRTVTELRERHTRLSSEVIELERLLEAKRREERTAASQLEDAETRIRQIRGKFEKQVKRLQVKKADVEAEKSECTMEAQTIAKAKKDFSLSKTQDRRTETNLLRQLTHNNKELSTAETLRNALLDQESRRQTLSKQAHEAAQAVEQSLQEVENAAKHMRNLQSRKAQLEAQASALKKTIASIDAKIPALNEEKKQAVAGKKFKEAGRLNDELKRVGDQRDDAARELSECTTGIDAAEEELSRSDATIRKLREASQTVEREQDLRRIDLLKEAVRELTIQTRKLGRKLHPVPVNPQIYEVDPVSLEKINDTNNSNDTNDEVSNETLGIDIDGGQSATQSAAVELLGAERDLLNEELNTYSNKLGVSADIGALPPLEDDTPVPTPKDTDDDDALPIETPKIESSAPSSPSAKDNNSTTTTSVSILNSFTVATTTETAVPESSLLASFGTSTETTEVPVASSLFAALSVGSSLPSTETAEGVPSLFGGLGFIAPSNTDASDDTPVETTTDETILPSTVDTEAARLKELSELALALSSIQVSIQEKNSVIEEAVGREDFDTADAAQADIDSMNDGRERILTRARELGVFSEDELVTYRDGGNSSSLSSSSTSVTGITTTTSFFDSLSAMSNESTVPSTDGGNMFTTSGLSFLSSTVPSTDTDSTNPIVASGLPFFSTMSTTATDASSVPVASALPFMVGGFDALGSGTTTTENVTEAEASTFALEE